ncbi:MAG: zinc ribbon domain-containing protein [Fusobacteriaceae bacterium]
MHKRQTGTRLSAKTPYLLAGLCECGICGSNYAAGYRTRKRDRSIHYGYICSGRKSKKTQCTCKPIRRELFEKKSSTLLKIKYLTMNKLKSLLMKFICL